MAKITPQSFYEWLMLLNAHHLKCGPLEAFKDSRVHHAISRTDSKITYGFWDHQTNTGYLDLDQSQAPKPEVKEILAAPPIPDGDKEWDL